MYKPDVAIVGGGMITHDQILPALLHMQRQGRIGEITVCASRHSTVKNLAAAPIWQRAFPGQSFRTLPDFEGLPLPHLYKDVIAAMRARQIVVAAVPDPLHFDVVMEAIQHDQHVCAVKPLVLKHYEGVQIGQAAYERGLVVGVEYHKRFDDRSLMARRKYREGQFGEFLLGTASLMEKWYYRHSNFQNWCTTENSDAFSYIGCHYVDLVHFITGLLPTGVSVYGIRDRYPNGNEGYLWTDARVLWENGACLNVQNTLSFPDEAPGTNTQGLTLYCRGAKNGALLSHSDQYRGLKYSYVEKSGDPGSTLYAEPSPDYFQYVDLGDGGLTPVGYGYRSVEYIVATSIRVEQEAAGAPAGDVLERRRQLIREIDAAGVMATPLNSGYNELVMEAGRLSLMHGGRLAAIHYQSADRGLDKVPGVSLA